MEEELPPGFWEEAQEPQPPSADVKRQVQVEDAADDVPTLEDPGFETLRALFPGRIVSIEASEAAEGDEEASSAAAGKDANGSEDGADQDRQE